MRTEDFLALGKFGPEDLIVSVSPSTRKIDPLIESQVDAIWEEKKKAAEAEGRVCFNGISYRLNSLEKQGDTLRIDFGLLEYKARYALTTIPEYLTLSTDYYHKGCFSGATVKTSDGLYVAVELSGKSMNTHAMDLLGGIMEKPSEIETGQSVFDCLTVELTEEGGITESDIKTFYLRAIWVTPRAHTSFYFEVELNISSKELLERFAKDNEDQDIRSLKFLTREEYVSFLNSHSANKLVIAGVLAI